MSDDTNVDPAANIPPSNVDTPPAPPTDPVPPAPPVADTPPAPPVETPPAPPADTGTGGTADADESRTAFVSGARAGDTCTCPDGRKGTVHKFDEGLVCIPNADQSE